MSDKDKYKKYDHSKAIGNHVNRINELITKGLQESEHEKFDLFFSQVIMSLMALDGMLDPFKDDGDDGEFEEVFEGKMKFNSMSRGDQLKFVHGAMKEYTNLMYREGLFYVSRSGRTEV